MVIGHVPLVKAHPRQALGVDAHGGAAAHVQYLHVAGKGIAAQAGGGAVHRPGQGGGGQRPQSDFIGGGLRLDQAPGGQAGLILIAIGLAVGGQDHGGAGGVGAPLAVGILGALNGRHHADALAGIGGGAGARGGARHGGHRPVPAQQQGHRVPQAILPQVGQGIGRGGALDLTGAARHRHGGGTVRILNGLDGPGDPVTVGPDGVHGPVPIDHVPVLHRGQGGQLPLAIDQRPGYGHGQVIFPAPADHQGALHGVADQGHQVDLPGGI